jgi:hypothetical protein
MTLSHSSGFDSSGLSAAAIPNAASKLRQGDATAAGAQSASRSRASTAATNKRRRAGKHADSKPPQPLLYDAHKLSHRRSLRLANDPPAADDGDDAPAATPRRNRERNPRHMSPESGALGSRTGRQFTVGNVGNNGRIYLRYGFFLLPPPSP